MFARDIGTFAGKELFKPSEINIPIRSQTDLQEIWIFAVGYLVADSDGAVRIPKGILEDVIAAVRVFQNADTAIDIIEFHLQKMPQSPVSGIY